MHPEYVMIIVLITGLVFFVAGLFIGYQMAKGDKDEG